MPVSRRSPSPRKVWEGSVLVCAPELPAPVFWNSSAELVAEPTGPVEEGSQDMVELSKGLMNRFRLKMKGQLQTMNEGMEKSITEVPI